VTTIAIQHADGANATNRTTFFLEHEGGIDFPQELSRQHHVGAGFRKKDRAGDSHYQAWPRTCRIHSHGVAGLWPPPERVALVSGMLCTLGNKL
jgi:hypothetical protein